MTKAHKENEKLKEDNRKEVYLRKKKRLIGGGQGIAHDDEYYTTRNQHTVEVYNAFKEVMEEPYYWLYERGKEIRNKKMETDVIKEVEVDAIEGVEETHRDEDSIHVKAMRAKTHFRNIVVF